MLRLLALAASLSHVLTPVVVVLSPEVLELLRWVIRGRFCDP